MQTTKFKYLLRTASVNKKYIIRTFANGAAVNDADASTATKSWFEVPGPSELPVIGQLHHFMPGGLLYKLNIEDVISTLYKTYGPIVRLSESKILGRPPMLMVFDAESTTKIMRSENWLPFRPELKSLQYYRNKYVKKNIDDPTGLITDQGEIWKKFRSAVNPVMLQPKTIKLYTSVLEQVSDDMITRMRSLRGDDNTIKSKFDVEMNLWALESIGVVALGDRLNCLDPNLPKDSPARKLIDVIHDFFMILEKVDFKPSLWKYIPTPAFKQAMRIYEEEYQLTKYFVTKAMEKLKTSESKSDEEKGVLEKLLEINEEYAIIMATDMLFAGVDTTSNTVTFTLYLLATNPEVQEKLRDEVLNNKDSKAYLKAVIKESLRVLPVVLRNARMTSKEYELLGYKVPKDTLVLFNHHIMSLSETYYPRPKEFLPERWLVPKDDPIYHGQAHPFAYSPFGFGVRSCIGRRIAELEIETFITKIMENFRVEWFGPPLKTHSTALNYAAAPFNFTFKDL